ncbi:TPA: restriction endonuclease subunit S [Serratia fonticola]
MKYKAYPKYKNSDVEWLGVMPYEWSITRLKFIANINMGQSPNSEDCNLDGNGIAFLQGNAEFGEISPKEKQYCLVPKKLAKPRELLFSVRAPVGALNIADKVYGIGRGLCSIRGLKDIKSTYLWWVLLCYKYQLDAIATGSTFEAVSAEQVGNLCLTLPSVLEQSQIVNFLDHETAKIDQLIAKQEKLIELLKEKRQAVISHAVTKGLNPDVKMKDSGVEWLGEVPEHWGVMQLRRYVKHIEQGKSPECEARLADDNEWAVLKSGCVNGGVFRQNEHKALPFNIKPHIEYEVKVGDLLMSRASGSVDLIGSVAFVETCREKLLLSDKFFRIILSKDMLPEYFSIIMKSDSIRNQIKLAINGAEGLANNITKEAIKSFFSSLPPISEQEEILHFIKERMLIIKEVDLKLVRSLRLLKERRSALISAAVTGKIDVRDWKPKDIA